MHFLLATPNKTKARTKTSKRSSSNPVKATLGIQPLSNSDSTNKSNKAVKAINQMDTKDNTLKPKHTADDKQCIATKTGSMGAKDVDTCLVCTWSFPHSFRGDEKNTHMDRCMENLGDEDKKFWSRCQGDLKQYMYGFSGFTPNRKSKESQNPETLSTTSQTRKPKKPRKKRIPRIAQTENGAADRDNKEKRRAVKDLGKFEPSLKKKVKTEEVNSKENIPVGKINYSKVVLMPIVKGLVFDPSKEFSKRLKK